MTDERSHDDILSIVALPRDLRNAAATLGRDEARYLVDTYYQMQDNRMATNNQGRALRRSEEPHLTVDFFAGQFLTLEKQIGSALGEFAKSDPLGEWALKNFGIGPVITAGLLAHIDITKAPTVGHIWAFAGLDPTKRWERGQRRPYNAKLKVLCWKIGESFKKFSNNEKCFYGKIYRERKQYEVDRNDAVVEIPANAVIDQKGTLGMTTVMLSIDGDLKTVYALPQGGDAPARWFTGGNAEWAFDTLTNKRIQDADTLERYRSGKLPDGRLDLRATRYATKLFLAHYHGEGYRLHHGEEPPLPYPIAHLGHAHLIEAPVPSIAEAA